MCLPGGTGTIGTPPSPTMKTVTEFSGLFLRDAHRIKQQKVSEGTPLEELTETIAKELNIPSARAQYLLGALTILGKDLSSVRLVRVYEGEPPPKARTQGDVHFVVDRINSNKKTKQGRGQKNRKRSRGTGQTSSRPSHPNSSAKRPPARNSAKLPTGGEGWSLTKKSRPKRNDRSRKPAAPIVETRRGTPKTTNKRKQQPTPSREKTGRRRNPQPRPKLPPGKLPLSSTGKRRIVVATGNSSETAPESPEDTSAEKS